MLSVDTAGLLRPGRDDQSMMDQIAEGLRAHARTQVAAFSGEEAEEVIRFLERSPLVRWFVFRVVKREAAAQGIDLDKLADFIIKIAPIIFEIIKMFM